MDDLEAGALPHCPDDGVLMRDISGGWQCPECGQLEMIPSQTAQKQMPPKFDGPGIHGG